MGINWEKLRTFTENPGFWLIVTAFILYAGRVKWLYVKRHISATNKDVVILLCLMLAMVIAAGKGW